jgi:hypothetical protein
MDNRVAVTAWPSRGTAGLLPDLQEFGSFRVKLGSARILANLAIRWLTPTIHGPTETRSASFDVAHFGVRLRLANGQVSP